MTRISTRMIKEIPNILVALRIGLSIFVNLYILNHFGNMLIPVITVFIIFMSDFLDGKIARLYDTTSKFGEVLDVLADLFYIVVSYIVLWTYNILPLWFLFIILYKFVEFIITSYLIERSNDKKSIFIFDFLGRGIAVVFYVLPISVYLSFCFSRSLYLFIVNICITIIPSLVLASTIYRIIQCISGSRKNEINTGG